MLIFENKCMKGESFQANKNLSNNFKKKSLTVEALSKMFWDD